MKKSILVAPALAVLLLGAAGSVGGTVAWFSSVSSVDADANTFKATALDGNLSVAMAAAQGTTLSGSVITVSDGSVLTHASYDHVNGAIYTKSNENTNKVREAVSAATVTSTAGSATPSNDWIARSNFDGHSHNIYYAVSWKMTFTYSFASETRMNLYFDPTSSLNSVKAKTQEQLQEGETNMDTFKGFRIAFVADATNSTSAVHPNTRVWGEERYQAADQDPSHIVARHILSTDASFSSANYGLTGSTYGATAFIGANLAAENKTARREGSLVAADDKDAFDCLGQFHTTDGAAKTLVFTCIAWFEGTDPEIATKPGMLMDTVSAHMVFYTREATAPAQQQEEPQNNG